MVIKKMNGKDLQGTKLEVEPYLSKIQRIKKFENESDLAERKTIVLKGVKMNISE